MSPKLDAEATDAIAECDGDPYAAVKMLLVALEFWQSLAGKLEAAVSPGFVRRDPGFAVPKRPLPASGLKAVAGGGKGNMSGNLTEARAESRVNKGRMMRQFTKLLYVKTRGRGLYEFTRDVMAGVPRDDQKFETRLLTCLSSYFRIAV